MKSHNNKLWQLHQIITREEAIDPKPQYQRSAGIWSERKQQLFIDSLLRGYDIPKIYLRKLSGEGYEHEVIDGQQRLRAIWKFRRGEFPLGDISEDLPQGNLVGKRHPDLSNDVKDYFNNLELAIAEIYEATDEEVRDLFSRLQEAVPLNSAERRNAMSGDMRDFIHGLSKHHPVFEVVYKENKRHLHDDWIAHVACLEVYGGEPRDIKAQDLKKMYEDYKKFDEDSVSAKKIKRVLRYFRKSFDVKPPEMKIKWGFVDYYFLISDLIDKYVLTDREKEFGDFYTGFEGERKEANDDPSELLKSSPDNPGSDAWNRDLYDYIEAFTKEGGVKKNIETRHGVYMRKALMSIPELIPKDETRSFDTNQRIVIWRRDNKQCKICPREIAFNEMHADHIKPHSKGGRTTIENGQALCESCNLEKGARNGGV